MRFTCPGQPLGVVLDAPAFWPRTGVSRAHGEGKSQIGGGTLPRSAIPSVTLDLQPLNISVTDFAARLRGGSPPVVGYVAAGRFKLDLRTVFPRQDEELFRAIHSAFATRTS